MWPWDRREKQLEELIAKADAAFEIPDFEEALPLADRIIELGHTYGFELKARALAGLDREPEALRVMEESVKVAPEVGQLWSYLGEYRSNSGDYAGAHAAFQRAGAVNPDLLEDSTINDAIVHLREEQPALALERLDAIKPRMAPGLRGRFARSRADALLDLERFDEAVDYCTSEIDMIRGADGLEPDDEDQIEDSLRSLQITKATALWRGRKDGAAALELCYSAVTLSGTRGPGFTLIREIGGLDASHSKPYQLLCHGKALIRFFEPSVSTASAPESERGYFTTFRVLADSPEEAFEFVRGFEMREWGEQFRSLVLEKSSEAPDKVTGCKGVYFRGGRTFYSGRDQEP